MDQWSLYIDIEGFSSTYAKDTQALESLGALMESIYKVGSRCYAESPHRLFAHQLGDGFVVVGEFGWATLEQPVSVANSKCTPSGPLLLLKEAEADRLPPWVRARAVEGFLAVDWIHSSSSALLDITRAAGLQPVDPTVMAAALRRYMESNDVSTRWRDNASRYLNANDGV